jgi:hypothetical protein
MLVIKNIKIQFDRTVVPVRIRALSISYKKDSFNTMKKFTQTDTHTFVWN